VFCPRSPTVRKSTTSAISPTRILVPRRLINVRSGDTEPFLFEPQQPCSYVALSYCWGVDISDVPVTTSARLDPYSSAIQLLTLPQTICDAIAFCRGIQAQYLWVDMLCIIQDNESDWATESSKMHLIYSNSFLTLAVHRPVSCFEGFLGEQSYGQEQWQKAFQATQKIPRSDLWLGVGNLYVRTAEAEPPAWRSSALKIRGWTLQ